MSACHDCALVARAGSPLATGPMSVALVGPPNSGKSSLFNRLTGLRQKVANYPGVTVEQRRGRLRLAAGRDVELLDLPGTYSLQSRSEDERITADVLHGRMPGVSRPGALLLVLDSTNLARHLVLAAPVLALGLPTLVVLNLSDDLERRGGSLDPAALARQLGAPVALASAATGRGLDTIREFLAGRFAVPTRVPLPTAQNIPACRLWAGRLTGDSTYRAPAPPLWTRRLDGVFLHPVAGPLLLLAVVLAVFQAMFSAAAPLSDGLEAVVGVAGRWTGVLLPAGVARDVVVQGVLAGVGSVIVFLPQIAVLFL
ncbi:MAG: FeoB small GTPase domain-containing protein, partial [Gemmatimonadota bacterium]